LGIVEPLLYSEDSIASPLIMDKNQLLTTDQTMQCADSMELDQIPSQLLHPPDAEELAELDQRWLYGEGMNVLDGNDADLSIDAVQPTPTKIPKLVNSRGRMSNVTQNQDRPIVIFVPVVLNAGTKRRGSQSSGSGSDGETSGIPRSGMYGISAPEGLKTPGLNRLLHNYALEQINSHHSLYSNAMESAQTTTELCPKKIRKVSFQT